jgi:hypothetical protein
LANLTSRITSEVQDVLGGARAGTAGITQQLQAFMGSLPQLGHGIMDGKMGNLDLIPNFQLPNFYGGGNMAAAGVPPVQPEAAAASPYDQLKAALNSYHTQ